MLELDRLAALRSLDILDTPPEERFDRIARLAAALFDVPITLVSLMDEERQWHKACVGPLEAETPRALTFCQYTIETPQPLIIPDTHHDERFVTHPMVTGEPYIRFYAGHPLSTVDGFRVGTLCVIDTRPRAFGPEQVGLLHDISRIAEDELNHTELSQALGAWRRSEQRFRAVFQDTAIGMTLVDRDGLFVEANPAFSAMIGISDEDLRGRPVMAVTHPGDHDQALPRMAALFTGEIDGYRQERRYVRPDGSMFWGAITASLLRDAEGLPDLAIGMVEDVTDRKEMERIKDELVSVVGHELRTPLTSIRGSLGLLEAGVAGELPGEAAKMVRIARENTERLVRLVNETLDLERLQHGRVDVDPRPVAPSELLEATAKVVQPFADEQDVELTWAADDVELVVDPDRIVQALVNLIANAVKFSPAASCVHTSIERDGDRALVSVVDAGRGIPPDQLEAIFERFRQVDASDHREKGGTGLGLAIARAIVEQHAGRIWAESEPGRGATFRITLPLHGAKTAIAVYDRRQQRREELMRAVRRHGRPAIAFDSPEALVAAGGGFAAVLVAGASGLDEIVAVAPVLEVEAAEDVETRVDELLEGLER